jgi:isopentenyldiphosphate isomerase
MDIVPNPNEVMDTAYVRRNELNEFLAEATRENGGVSGVTPWFGLIAKHYLPMWWDDLDNIDAHADQISIKKFS